MARYKDLDSFIRALDEKTKKVIPRIVAETAVEYFKGSFAKKAWENTKWKETKMPVKRGSLLLRSSMLANSIRPSFISQDKVRINAGSAKVPYAKIHNEGGEIAVTAKMKKFAWAMYYKNVNGVVYDVKTKSAKYNTATKSLVSQANMWKGMALKKVGSKIIIPQRQFMGKSQGLNETILERIMKEMRNL